MAVHEIGPDEFGYYPDDAKWTVTHYESCGYDGWGLSISLMPDGFLYIKDLSHCSCNDPNDNEADKVSVADFLENRSSVHSYCMNEEVEEKVCELLERAEGTDNA